MRRGRGVAFDGPRVEALFEAGGGRIELSEVRTLVRACGGGAHPRDLRDLGAPATAHLASFLAWCRGMNQTGSELAAV